MVTAPLSGITVIAFEHAIAAPFCTRQLGELGARVIKIERRDGGDFARGYDTRAKGQSSHFIWTNRSKQSLTLDLKHELAGPILQRLLSQADVLVQNLAPGAAQKLGLSYAALREKYQRLIVCNISGYGVGGPYQRKKAYDLLVQAEAGFLSVTGSPDAMAKSGISIADIAAGTQAHAAILAALIQRGKTGVGSEISVSMLEAMVEWMGFPLYYTYDGATPPPRSGSEHATIYPYGAFTSADDRTIMIGLQNEREWALFCHHVMQDPSLATDVRFASNSQRSEYRDVLRSLIQSLLQTLPADQIRQRLDLGKIAHADVNTMADVWSHPQLEALQRFMEFETPAGKLRGIKPPVDNSSFAPSIGPVPAVGEHTESILGELGFTSAQITSFRQAGVV